MALFADAAAAARSLGRPEVPQPRFLELRDPDEDVAAAARAGDLRFPLLCKPLVACGPAASHELAVALCEEGLSQVRPPVLLQEYVAHRGAVMYKGYCVGRRVHVAQRASLPDLRLAGRDGAATTLVRFDSQKPPPSASAFGAGTAAGVEPVMDGTGPSTASAEEERRRACTEQIASRVGEQLGVELLGVVFAELSTTVGGGRQLLPARSALLSRLCTGAVRSRPAAHASPEQAHPLAHPCTSVGSRC